jgi:zinc-ribbon domain
MSISSAASINRRCANCGAVARQGAVYCPQCGTPMSSAIPPVTPPVAKPPRSKGKFPWITLLFICCFFGVFHRHHEPVASPSADAFQSPPALPAQNVPQDVLAAIQPSQDARWDGGDVGLKIYNGSQWTITQLDLEIQINRGFHAVPQTYRASISATPLQPLSSEYVTVRTALPRMYDGPVVRYRVVGAMGSRPE